MAGETTISRTFGLLETATDPSNIDGLWDVITSNIPTIHYVLDDAMEAPPGDFVQFRVFKELMSAVGAGRTATITANYPTPWTTGRYGYKFIYVPFRLPNQDLVLNAGEAQLFDIVKDSMAAAIRTMISALGGSTLGIWTANSNDETEKTKITGLPSIIKSSGNTTGTTGEISRTNTFWQNQTATAITSFATDGITRYRQLLLNAKRGTDFPDWGVTNDTQFLNYLATFSSDVNMNQPITGDRFDVGVPDIRLHGLTVFSDDNAPANEFRAINSEYLKLMLLSGDYLSFSPAIASEEKDDTVIRLRFTGNLWCPDIARQGVVTGGDTA